MFERTLTNISERHLLGLFLTLFKPPIRLSTIGWGKECRVMSSTETTVNVGNFDPLLNPCMEYVYECLDNPYIPIITARKPARIGWTEVINTYRGRRIHTDPCVMLLGFPTIGMAKTFAKGKWKEFLNNVVVLKEIVDKGIPNNRRSLFDYKFDNGELRLRTLNAISNVKSDNLPYIEVEEPDDTKDGVADQGDLLSNLSERQKLVPITRRKLIYGGTPTNKDFSRVEKGIKQSNQLIFKAECHNCKELIAMDGPSFDNIVYDDFQDRVIDEVFGKSDPESARFICPSCGCEWSFEQKNINVINGKKYGFIDHTGNFSKGWHPNRPEVKKNFGFIFSELLSPFPASNFVELATAEILAKIEKAKGNEKLMKSFYNNRRGEAYAGGFSAMEVEEMVKLRSNYPELLVQAEGLALTAGIDVQHNRFAIVLLAHGRNGNLWLTHWVEIFGNVLNGEDPVWQELTDYCLQQIPHITGKTLPISAVDIDAADGITAELVYRWVKKMNNLPEFQGNVRAVHGVRELKYSTDEIYTEPPEVDIITYKQARKTLAQTMDVKVFKIGAHRAHDEILRRIGLNKIPECRRDRFYFCETAYGNFEEQILSCRKLIDTTGNTNKEYYKLVSGKRKEAMDGCKMALHAGIAAGIRDFTDEKWKRIENYLFK